MSTSPELAAFLGGLESTQVSADVLHGTRRMLLDTLGCIISARATEAGRISSQFAAMLGGSASPAGAAYLHGRLADAMDFNEGYSGAHFGSGAVAAALALAREPGVTGKDFLLAVAAGYELGGRIQDAMGSYYTTVDGKQAFAPVWGIATPIVYAAAGASTRMLRFDPALTEQAWGLAGSNSPIPIGAKWSAAVDLPNTKYCDAGWCSLVGVTGALSARFGSTGLTSLLDDGNGLLRMVSALNPAHERLFAELGTRWCVSEIGYKEWPACGLLEGPMRLVRGLVDEHRIDPAAIDRIEVEVGSAILVPRFVNPDPRTFASLQFNMSHAAAMLLLEVPVGPAWLSMDLAMQAHVAALRRKVVMREHREPWPAKGRKRPCSVRITAGDRSWFAQTLTNDSQPATEPPWSDERIVAKFMSLVDAAQASRIVDAVMGIESAASPLALLDAFERAVPSQ
jgi:2-methylcitrate dehydratase PrpD